MKLKVSEEKRPDEDKKSPLSPHDICGKGDRICSVHFIQNKFKKSEGLITDISEFLKSLGFLVTI